MQHPSLTTITCVLVATLAASTVMASDLDAQSMNCVILPDEVVDISSSVPGVLEEMLVDRADPIEKGQVLARMEASVEQAVTELARARASAISEVKLRETELGYDVQHRDRLSQLQQRHVASSQSYEDAERTAQAAHWRMKLAEERRVQAQLDQRRASAVLAQKTIRSPIDGVVIARHHSVGEHVNSEAVVTVARLDPLRVEVLTPIEMFGKIKPGMVMDVRAEIDPETPRRAKVVAVDPVADAGSGMFAVELTLPNPDNALPAGIKCYSEVLDQNVPRVEPASTVAAAPKQPPAADVRTVASVQDERVQAQTRSGDLCRVFAALSDAESTSRIVRTAVALGGRAHKIATEIALPHGYLVASQPASNQQLHRWQEQLHRAGEPDTVIMSRGEFRQRLTMGVYNGPRSAERRRAQIEALGINAEVLPRTRTSTGWDVEVQLPQPLPAPANTPPLAEFVESLNNDATPCADVRAASL